MSSTISNLSGNACAGDEANNSISRLVNCSKPCMKDLINQYIPVSKWLPSYKWRRHFLSDLIAGATIGVMHIPQGIAYAFLAHLPPMVGIYMGFFPVLVYFIFGTSRHMSLGSFAIGSLMTADAILSHNVSVDVHTLPNGSQYTALEVATAVTMMVGLYEMLMFCLRLGIVCTILSETIISAFTAGAAIHVITSQVKNLLGIKIKRHFGPLSIIYTFQDILVHIQDTNLATLLVSVITISVQLLEIVFLRSYLKKRWNCRLPMELLVLIIATVVSTFTDINRKYGIEPVGEHLEGFPSPRFPHWELLSTTAVDSFFITLVAYSVSVSVTIMYATTLRYQVDPNQEMLAHGLANMVGSCFSCMAVAGSLSRSSVQKQAGGRSQIASVISAILLLAVMFWLGPFFEPLPRATLSGVIVVALRGTIMQITNFPAIWKISKLDGVIWFTLITVVVAVNIIYGLMCGVILLLISVLIQNMKPPVYLVGRVPKQWDDTDDGRAYVDLKCPAAAETRGIKIIQIRGPINFATWIHVKKQIEELSGVCPSEVLRVKQGILMMNMTDDEILQQETEFLTSKYRLESTGSEPPVTCKARLQLIILDLTMVPFFDLAGVNAIRSLTTLYNKINVKLLTVSCNESLQSCHISIAEALRANEVTSN